MNIYAIGIALIAAITGILFGYDTGVIAGALVFIKQSFSLSSWEEGAVVGVLLLGAAVGALGMGVVANILGRKTLLKIVSLAFLIGSIGLFFATSVTDLLIYRFVLGLAIGVSSFAAPNYIAEIAPAHLRGRLVSLFQLAVVFGILIVYFSNYLLLNLGNNWRYMFLLGAVPALILFFGLIFLPESPRFLLLKKREKEAKEVLSKLRKDDISNELTMIRETIFLEKKNNLSFFFEKHHHKLMAIVFFIMIFNQFTGINAIIYYAPKIFIASGLTSQESFFNTVLVGLILFIFTAIGLSLLDKLGRRFLMLFGTSIMLASLILFVVANYLGIEKYSVLALASILGYIAGFAVSQGLVVWLIASEIFPLSIRGEGAAMGAFFNWTFNMLLSFSFPTLLDKFGTTTIFVFFALMCACCIIYILRYLPETKNVPLETIEKNLYAGARSRNLGA